MWRSCRMSVRRTRNNSRSDESCNTSETDIRDLEFVGSKSADEIDHLREELTGAQSIISRDDDDRARAKLNGMGKESAERASEAADSAFEEREEAEAKVRERHGRSSG
jgi:hypothetical protein